MRRRMSNRRSLFNIGVGFLLRALGGATRRWLSEPQRALGLAEFVHYGLLGAIVI
jgi:hypothetical protein